MCGGGELPAPGEELGTEKQTSRLELGKFEILEFKI